MTEQEARRQILDMVSAYCAEFHLKDKDRPLREGERIHYAGRVYDSEEMVNLTDSALDFWLTMGRYTRAFEKGLSEYLGLRFVSAVSSGSSANLLAFMALTSPLLGDRRIKRGDEVITVAAGFPTTVTPIINYGAVPVFIDVDIPQYNLDPDRLEAALSPRTRAVMAAHTLGNPFDLRAVKDFCDRHGLWLIEDNCDALGSEYDMGDGRGLRRTGTIGDIGTSSFYPPHHMTMGEGGAVYTDDPLLNRIIRSMRDWGRDCICESGQDNRCGHRFDGQYGELPKGYDHKYVYSHLGYNLGITDMQAAVGCAQLKKLQGFTEKRRHNFDILHAELSDLADRLILPEAAPHSVPSWFGFCMTLREGIDRSKVVRYMEDKGVQTRLLFAGNFVKQPCFDHIRGDESFYRVSGELTNTDRIMRDSFWIGVYPGMTDDRLLYMAEQLRAAIRSI